MLSPNQDLDDILAEMRREHRKIQPPAFLTTRLRAERTAAPGRSKSLALSWSIAAALVVLMILTARKPGVRVQELRPKLSELSPQPRVEPAPKSEARVAVARLSTRSAAQKPRKRDDGEAVTEFMELPGTATMPAAVETSILRVRLARGDLRQYGFDIPAQVASEIVRADFMVGSDGLARAIRLVR